MKKEKKEQFPKLRDDSYYWKRFEDDFSIKYAYIHVDKDDGDYTFLIVFESSDANDYAVYTTLEKEGEVREKDKRVIQEFLLEIETPTSLKENTGCWSLFEKPKMTLHNKAFKIVDKYMDNVTQKKNEKENKTI